MLHRYENIERIAFEKMFKQEINMPFSESEIEAYKKGQLDKVSGKPCNPSEHGYRELSKERCHYEAGYMNEECLTCSKN